MDIKEYLQTRDFWKQRIKMDERATRFFDLLTQMYSPTVNLIREFEKMELWLLANKRENSIKNWIRFIQNWFSKIEWRLYAGKDRPTQGFTEYTPSKRIERTR